MAAENAALDALALSDNRVRAGRTGQLAAHAGLERATRQRASRKGARANPHTGAACGRHRPTFPNARRCRHLVRATSHVMAAQPPARGRPGAHCGSCDRAACFRARRLAARDASATGRQCNRATMASAGAGVGSGRGCVHTGLPAQLGSDWEAADRRTFREDKHGKACGAVRGNVSERLSNDRADGRTYTKGSGGDKSSGAAICGNGQQHKPTPRRINDIGV